MSRLAPWLMEIVPLGKLSICNPRFSCRLLRTRRPGSLGGLRRRMVWTSAGGDQQAKIGLLSTPPTAKVNALGYHTLSDDDEDLPRNGALFSGNETAAVAPPLVYDFDQLGVNRVLQNKMSALGYEMPTDIQSKAIPTVLARQHTYIHSPTGTGKTLAYVLPMLQIALKRPSTPYQTILFVPSRELGNQVLHLMQRLVDESMASPNFFYTLYTGKRAVCVDQTADDAQALAKAQPGIIIATPRSMASMLKLPECPKGLKAVKSIYVDEAELLFEPPSRYAPLERLNKLQKKPPPILDVLQTLSPSDKKPTFQLVCISATINAPLRNLLRHWIPNAKLRQSGELYRTPDNVRHTYAVTYADSGEDRLSILTRLLRRGEGKERALVVIDTHEPVAQFVNAMANRKVHCKALYQDLSNADVEHREAFLQRYCEGQFVGVATEATLRGLDFDFLTHVYLVEVPRTATEYLHLSGRCGRMGRHGTVVSIVNEKELKRLEATAKILKADLLELLIDVETL